MSYKKITFGIKARVSLKNGTTRIFRNLTEVHHNAPISHEITAFESDFHGTGLTIMTKEITEMEILVDNVLNSSMEE